MNLSDQVMGDEAAWELCNHEIQLDRQRRASEVRDRILTGMATIKDAMWIEAEYGLNVALNRKGLK